MRNSEHTHESDSADKTRRNLSVRQLGFETTQWSLVLKATDSHPDSRLALESLCQSYWQPLYFYARRRVQDPEKAQDLTQAFFAKLLEKNYLKDADPTRGRCRAFMLTAMKRFMANEWDKENALKRGGHFKTLSLDFDKGERNYQLTPTEDTTPDQLFMQKWVRTLLDNVFDKLTAEYQADDKASEFDALKSFITQGNKKPNASQVGERLGMSETAVRAAAHRLRKRYRSILRAEIAETVELDADVEDEIRDLFKAFE